MITARLVGDDATLARLRALPAAVNAGLARAIAQLGRDLQQSVEDRLSGPVLAVRSGALRASIDLQLDQRSGSLTAVVSSNSDYGRAHEYGFAGTVDVRAGLRRIREAFGRPIAEKTVNVRAYSRRMALPERSFLRSALEEMTPDIRDAIEAVLREAVIG